MELVSPARTLLSLNQEYEYVVEGVTEELIGALMDTTGQNRSVVVLIVAAGVNRRVIGCAELMVVQPFTVWASV